MRCDWRPLVSVGERGQEAEEGRGAAVQPVSARHREGLRDWRELAAAADGQPGREPHAADAVRGARREADGAVLPEPERVRPEGHDRRGARDHQSDQYHRPVCGTVSRA